MNEVFKNLDRCGNFKINHVGHRTLDSIEKLKDFNLITINELCRILKLTKSMYQYLIYSNKKYYRRNLYPINLLEFIKKYDIKKLQNKLFVKKSDVKYFTDFLIWFRTLQDLNKQKTAFKKAMIKFYGTPKKTTKTCINSNFNCEECENAQICSIYHTNITQKQIAKFMNLLFSREELQNVGN